MKTTIRNRTWRFFSACGALLLPLVFAGGAYATTLTFGTAGAGGAGSTESWTVPEGVTSVQVELWGGGASGGNQRFANANTGGGSGGGGGGYSVTDVAVTPGETISFYVGGGGPVSGGNNDAGQPGEDSTFPGATTATGGSPFSITEGGGNGASNGVGGDGGTGTFPGGSGGKGSAAGSGAGGGSGSATEAGNSTAGSTGPTDQTIVGGSAGAGGGAGAGGQTVAGAGFAGSYPGGGGSGGFNLNSAGKKNGGPGGNGQVVLTFFVDGANKLVVTSVPGSVTAGADFSVIVQAQNSSGNPINVTADTDISLTALGHGSLSGNTATIPMGSDSVTLSGVQYTKVESITLTAHVISGDVLEDSVASSVVAVEPAAASQLVFTRQPSPASTISVPFASQPVVQILDAFGNLITSGADASATVEMNLSSGTGNLGGTTSVAAVDGQADFSDLSIDDFGTDKVLTATATLSGPGVVAVDTSPAFAIIRDPAEQPLRWAIDMSGDWDTTTLWKDTFGNDVVAISTDQLRFDDSYLTDDTTVSVSGTVSSGNVQIANDVYNYIFDGSGDIAGTTSLSKSAFAELTMAGAYSFSGGMTLNGGILNINNGGSSSANSAIGTGTFTINGGIIDNTSGGAITLMTNNPVSLGNADFEFDGTQDLNFGTGPVSLALPATGMSRTIYLNGPGSTLTFGGNVQGSNRAGGQTIVVDGESSTLVMGALGLNGNPSGARTNSWAGSADVTVLGEVSGLAIDGGGGGKNNHAFTYAGTGTFTIAGAGTYLGATTISEGGTLQIGTAGTTGSLSPSSNITTNGTLAFNRSDTIAQGTDFASVIGGSGGVTQLGAGTLILNGANSYTGTTAVNRGILALEVGGSLADRSSVAIDGGVIDLADGVIDTIASLTISGINGDAPLPDGEYGNSASGADNGGLGVGALDAFLTGSGSFIVTAGTAFQIWAGGELFDEDSNDDGVDNGIAWILGAADPNADAVSLLPAPVVSGGEMSMSFPVVDAIAPARLFIEYSNDLGATAPWNSVEVPATSGTVYDVVFVIAPGSVSFTIPASKSVDGKLFSRLRATEN
ncbi:beta strand repeat-containing protein [Haloferula chungangensis]|uniref:Beta strand repeat-containing protein n=1 Tax=Haloferula chungangensis TaxID=1048331 RepID=A0ABW2LAU6_9BACT